LTQDGLPLLGGHVTVVPSDVVGHGLAHDVSLRLAGVSRAMATDQPGGV
jgi:hypothetical protein